MNSDEEKVCDEKTVRSAAEQIREKLEQFQDEEFILQIPLDDAGESEVKDHA
ncbi:MAG: hypothetical protein ACI4W2_08070 [Eubacterium sp.]